MRELQIRGRKRVECINAVLAMILVVSLAMGLITLLAINWKKFGETILDLTKKILAGVSVVSALGLIADLFSSKNEKVSAALNIFFRVGWILVLPVLFAWLLYFLAQFKAYEMPYHLLTLAFAFFFLIASLFIDTNRISLHHFYRDRLSEAYVIKIERKRNDDCKVVEEKIASNEPLLVSKLHEHKNGAPYHLINTTLNVPGSDDRYLRGRGADLFFFSKNYVGSEVTGYRNTENYNKGKTRLATVMAISGAAASPQMGTSTNAGLRTLLTLLNVRLNRWMPNPNPKYDKKIKLWPWYFIKEILGTAKEKDRLLNLSDGGHHENLGVYPLLKRRCRLIIASDATADPGYSMKDLANVIGKARIDLGVNVEINLDNLRPDPDTRETKSYYAVGDILYPDGVNGKLIYIKTSITGNEAEDLLAYRRKHTRFPDESTADQFFDETQFESYRKLGETAALKTFKLQP
jgi:MFS family permease